ncbi:MAG: filamentous hemagglutinin family protein [Hydrogenophilaceae bacterium]|nr:filamentous hemagglutinin family protein [Hydrogenophilaceae bacterium]
MNANLFRLVFNKKLGMYVPVHEAARSHGKDSGKAVRAAAVLAALLMAWGVEGFAVQPAEMVLHSTLAPVNAAIDAARTNASQLTIRQSAAKAIISWSKLNVRANESLIFDQQGHRDWSALNRIYDNAPSTIAGRVKADGHVYFINTNGILFANGAQVNVGSMTASSLDITDDVFNNGILADNTRPAIFQGTTGFVRVEAGATLEAASGGRIMLLAPGDEAHGGGVKNEGVIETPDGQTILAAGQKVYLNDTKDPVGIVVEVDAGGEAVNLGKIIAKRGNVSLVGLAVKQMGTITATSSVRSGGSIFLRARDTVQKQLDKSSNDYDSDGDTEETAIFATRTGTVVLGRDSLTEVLVETEDKEEILDQQAFSPSRIDIQGRTVQIDGRIEARGGQVDVSAVVNPRVINKDGSYNKTTYQNYADAGTRIYLGETAKIDVSGLQDVAMAMEDHQIEVKLNSEQLKDAPLLRGGPLFGNVVYLDDREGTKLFDYSAAAALNGKTVAEKSAAGGKVSLKSEGELITRQGSEINLSGGSLNYAGGSIKTSSFTYKGQVIDIADATPDVPYDGILNVVYSQTDPKWGVTRTWNLGGQQGSTYHPGYVQGMDAGSLTLWAPAGFALHGTVKADTITGSLQRVKPPKGGRFIMGQEVINNQNLTPDFVRIVRDKASLPAGFGPGDALPGGNGVNQLAAAGFAGFSEFTAAADQQLAVDAPLDIQPGGKVGLTAVDLQINADIRTPGGDISLKGGNTSIADGVSLSAAGLWTNDGPGLSGALSAPVALDGGKVTINGLTRLGTGSLVDVSAGAWRDAEGDVATGDAGTITLKGLDPDLDGELAGYGFGKGGGALTIEVDRNIQIGGADPGTGWFWLGEGFFQQGGFSRYDISAPNLNGGQVHIGDGSGTRIQARASSYLLPTSTATLASSDSLRNIARYILLPEAKRAPVDLKFAAANSSTIIGSLLVAKNTFIGTDPGGSIELAAGDRLTMLGSLEARAGDIKLTLSADSTTFAYDDSRAIWIGKDASLNATGYFKAEPPDRSGLIKGELMAGGDIVIDAKKGYVVVEEGAQLDVSGVSAKVDLPVPGGYARQTLAGDAGSIRLSAREGLLLDGALRGSAGGKGAAGGSLSLALFGTYIDPLNNTTGVPMGGRVLTVTQDYSQAAAGLEPDDNLTADGPAVDSKDYSGRARISAERIEDGGFDRLSLASYISGRPAQTGADRVDLAARLTLELPAAVVVDTPLLKVGGTGSAQIDTAYFQLTNNSGKAADSEAVTATPGNSLTVNADWIDLNGQLAVAGAETVKLDSRLDIRARGLVTSTQANGSHAVNGWLKVPSSLNLTARQVYPASASDFRFETLGTGKTLTVQRAYANSQPVADVPVLSAAGRLEFKADNIVQAGVVKAPLGEILLDAAKSLTLAAGSLTSVSAEGQIIPYGTTVLGGREWKQQNQGAADIELESPRAKQVKLKGDDIDQQAGAVIDISGNGDLMAYEFIQGINGSEDILGRKDVFAVLPGQQEGYAPYDWNYGNGSELSPGDAVYLSGTPGLKAGYYTLLPARYALLPGAYLVESQSGTRDMRAVENRTLADGSRLVAGYRANLAGDSRDARQSGFRLTPGSSLQSVSGIYQGRAEYLRSYANSYFPAKAAYEGTLTPRLPGDAGQLIAEAGQKLALNGTLETATGGRGALVDIVSQNMRVVSDVGTDDGTLQLDADMLTALGVESLLLGGTRSFTAEGVQIATGAQALSFDNDASHPLQGQEILAVASDSLTVSDAAALIASSDRPVAEQAPLLLSGDGALIRLSGLGDAAILRSGAAGAKGNLAIGSGALLKASRALALDARRNFSNAGSLKLDDGGAAYFGATRISLGNVPGFAQGLALTSADLTALGKLARLTLSSNSTLDLYDGMQFGNEDLELIVQSGGIAGYANTGKTATLKADTVILSNPNQVAFTQAGGQTLGDGKLRIEANRIELGRAGLTQNSQDLTIAGFGEAKLVTPGEIVAQAKGKLDFQGASASLTSGRITTASGVEYTVQGNGNMTLDRHADANTFAAAPEGLGGKLTVAANALTVAGTVELPSGTITLKSTGANQDLTLTGDARVLAKGSATRFDGSDYYTPGGSVILNAEGSNGNVVVKENAEVDVSSAGSDAGLVDVYAANKAIVESGAKLKAEAGGDGLGGRFRLDAANANSSAAASGNDFSALNAVLEAGGFRGGRQIRLRNGDVEIASGDTVRTGRFVLTAEAGKIDVKGTVDASGIKAGDIAIQAENNVTLFNGATLNASATGQGEAGGRVFLSSDSGSLDLQTGSTVNVAGGTGGRGGLLHLRAKRNAGNTDLNVTALAGTITGAEAVRLEGYKTYITTSMNNTYLTGGAVNTETTSFMSRLGAIRNRLNMGSNAAFQLTPGIEVQSTGANDLTLSADTTLHTLRYDPDTGAVASAGQLATGLNGAGKPLLAGVLTLRTANNININGSLSDGFSTALATTGVVQGVESWSYRLVAGADLASADPLGLLRAPASGKGNFTVAASKLVRTGKGSIDIAAAGNLTLGNDGSAIYTAGHAADALAGFTPYTSTPAPAYLTRGGDINVYVRGNIEGKTAVGSSQQLITNWLFRQGGGSQSRDVSWWLRPDLFKQNLAALGGGDVRIEAGGNIKNFSAAIPTTGRVPNKDPDQVVIDGGGDLLVRAGGDILSGVYYVGKGEGRLIAGGRIDDADGQRGSKNSANFGTTLALQDGRFSVQASGDAFIDTVFNPTLWAHSTTNASSIEQTGLASYFNTYAPGSGVAMQSLRGDVVFSSPDKETVVNKVKTGTNATSLSNSDSLFIQPGNMSAVAHRGSVDVAQMTLMPDPNGNLSLLAHDDVNLIQQSSGFGGIYMSDADIALMASLAAPVQGLSKVGSSGALDLLQATHAVQPTHAGDAVPARLVANTGSVGYKYVPGITTTSDLGSIPLVLAKQARIVAGKDILGLDLRAQHTSAGDQTTLSAGRDVRFGANAGSTKRIEVSGSGELLIQAGRHIDMGASGGVVTTANLTNPALPAESSNVTLMAGLGEQGADLAGYIARYIKQDGAGPDALAGDAEALAEYRQQTAAALTAHMRRITGNANLTEQDALTQFLALDTSRQAPFVNRHFSGELLASGKAAAISDNDDRGYAAIASLFPHGGYQGDISMYNSQVKTLRNASIDLLAPGGLVNAGLPGSGTGGEIGVVTERGGAIRAFSDRGFLVNQSKVITQYASDITVWVSNGDIDAGRGSTTAVSVPKKVVTTTADGYTTVEFNGVATGSGIRAQTYDPDGPNGPIEKPDIKGVTVALLAPRGVLNAGEAGIEAGNFIGRANLVLNIGNIKVQGTTAGVSLDAGGIAAPPPPTLPDSSKMGEETTRSLAGAQRFDSSRFAQQALADFKPSFITVQVLGFGI